MQKLHGCTASTGGAIMTHTPDLFEAGPHPRDLWRETIEGDGGHCPVCDRWGKVYKRNINETMARSLVWLYANRSEEGWVDVPNTAPRWLVRSNQLPTLAWWNLVERMENDGYNMTKFSGLWRTTSQGLDFIQGGEVPKSVFTYNNCVEGFSKDFVHLRDCFSSHFDYEEVMAHRFNDGKPTTGPTP
jgi:hypothetical protein